MQPLVNNVLVIGAGLIGGSLAKAIRKKGLAASVAGYGRRKELLQQGVELGILDQVADDLPAAVAAADVIVLGVPTLTIKDYLTVIKEYKKPGAIVTDVASVKGEVAAVVRQCFGVLPDWFVLGHPIAGSEKSGITAADADLYVNHIVVLTPDVNTSAAALQLVTDLWSAVGATVELMTVEQHDNLLAATSHLPHALAFSLVHMLANMDASDNVFRFAAGGFRDFTRIASSDPQMWHDIMLANRDSMVNVLGRFRQTLGQLEAAIQSGDGKAITEMFTCAKAARDEFSVLLQNRQKEDEL